MPVRTRGIWPWSSATRASPGGTGGMGRLEAGRVAGAGGFGLDVDMRLPRNGGRAVTYCASEGRRMPDVGMAGVPWLGGGGGGWGGLGGGRGGGAGGFGLDVDMRLPRNGGRAVTYCASEGRRMPDVGMAGVPCLGCGAVLLCELHTCGHWPHVGIVRWE